MMMAFLRDFKDFLFTAEVERQILNFNYGVTLRWIVGFKFLCIQLNHDNYTC
jgi:hypothetical protein